MKRSYDNSYYHDKATEPIPEIYSISANNRARRPAVPQLCFRLDYDLSGGERIVKASDQISQSYHSNNSNSIHGVGDEHLPYYNVNGSSYDVSASYNVSAASNAQATVVSPQKTAPPTTLGVWNTSGGLTGIPRDSYILAYSNENEGYALVTKDPAIIQNHPRASKEAEALYHVLRKSRFAPNEDETGKQRHLIYVPSLAATLIAALASLTCALCMHNYDAIQNEQHLMPQLHSASTWLSILDEPSPSVFVAATLMHGITTLAYYNLRHTDRGRETFLGTGIVGSTGAGLWAGANIQSILVGILPMITITSLLLCTGFNKFVEVYGISEGWNQGTSSDLEAQSKK